MIEAHATAVIDPCAQIGEGVAIGPYAVVGPSVTIGDDTIVASHAVIERNSNIGPRCHIGIGSVIGNDPQDLKYQGEESWVEIGGDTRIREYCTINRGTAATGTTRIGDNCYLMTYVHVAHDCLVEDGAIIANSVQLGGHVHIGRHAAVGGLTPVHQFVRIGEYAFVGGGSRVAMDVAPYGRAAGNPLRLVGPNTVGLTRAGFPDATRLAIKHAYRTLFNSDLRLAEAADSLQDSPIPEIRELVSFVRGSERGITR